MKIQLRSKLIIALTSLFIVPIAIVILTVILIRFNFIKIPDLQNIDYSTIHIVTDGQNLNEKIRPCCNHLQQQNVMM